MTDQEESGPREHLYDEHIAPRMAELIALAKVHGIAMFATFKLDGDMTCTTSQPNGDDSAEELLWRLMAVTRRQFRPIGPWEETVLQLHPDQDWVSNARRFDRYGRPGDNEPGT